MKKLVLTLALLLPLAAAAQTDFSGGARVSVGADYKIRKGLHITLEEEARMHGWALIPERLQTTVGIDYKPVRFLKLGLGYTLISPFDNVASSFKPLRHRAYLDIAGHFNLGHFAFSIKERGQYTHRTGTFNVYQNTPDAFALKSRFGIEYQGWLHVQPGLFMELRTQLNGPWGETRGSIQVKDDGTTYYAYIPTGYTHIYNDRYRFILRTDIKLGKHNVLRPYVYLDFCSPYVIDTNAEGTRLFSAAYVDQIYLTGGLSYTFKF